jgi:gliding motility associated protien GldN
MYRKKIKGILLIGSFLLLGKTTDLNAQSIPASAKENGAYQIATTLAKANAPAVEQIRGEDMLWMREVYRMLDLKAGQNGALYYPVEPSEEQMNLFSIIFTLVAKDKITAYEYLDGRELFTPEYAIKFKDLLKRFEIPYKEKTDPQKPNASIFEINAIDIPSEEVSLFYVKEIWFLDQRNSSMKVRTLALCPVLIREDETGETRRHPMFWIPFESLKPYLAQMAVAADDKNSASRLSVYDFFNQRRYEGEIYKVSNLKNQTIWDYCKTPEAIKSEQKRLENELNAMGTTLWEPSQKEEREKAELQKGGGTRNLTNKKRNN